MPKRFILGYESLIDIFNSVFNSVFKFPALVSGILGLAGFIFSSPKAIILLFFIMILDWVTGAIKAYKLPNHKFTSFKFQRMILNIVVAFTLIGISYHLGTALLVFKLIHLDAFLVGAFSATYLLSIVENLHELGWIPEKIYKYVQILLNLDNLIKKFFGKINADVLKDIENDEPKSE